MDTFGLPGDTNEINSCRAKNKHTLALNFFAKCHFNRISKPFLNYFTPVNSPSLYHYFDWLA